MLAAIATIDGKVISKHFGKTPKFAIIEIDETTWKWSFLEYRENAVACQGAGHDEKSFEKSIDTICDCGVVFVAKIGPYGKIAIERRNIQVLEIKGFIGEILDKYIESLKRKKTKHRDISSDHPCFSDDAHGRKGRLHLPISVDCNIGCRFCARATNDYEQRPGVSAGLISVEDAVLTVERALVLCPDITVVGIAGPGDALASPHAVEAFRRINDQYPDLILCLSTNGLALPGKAKTLYEIGVRALTVTVNAVDPDITAKIVSHIVYNGKTIRCTEAGRILIGNQLKGIRESAAAGITVKANTVLIPTVNDGHIGEIARAVSEAGASKHNIIPLIPQHELVHLPSPTCEELNKARAIASEYISQFRYCEHCRADACGIPGKSDFGNMLYAEYIAETFSHG
jgi:nitrogen fixation protein NifB